MRGGWRYTVPDHHADLLAALEGGDEGLVGDDVQLLDHLAVAMKIEQGWLFWLGTSRYNRFENAGRVGPTYPCTLVVPSTP